MLESKFLSSEVCSLWWQRKSVLWEDISCKSFACIPTIPSTGRSPSRTQWSLVIRQSNHSQASYCLLAALSGHHCCHTLCSCLVHGTPFYLSIWSPVTSVTAPFCLHSCVAPKFFRGSWFQPQIVIHLQYPISKLPHSDLLRTQTLLTAAQV